MTVQIKYKNSALKKEASNPVLFVDEKFNILSLKKHILTSEFTFISDLLKTKDLKKKILTFDISSKRKIILVALKNKLTSSDLENLGGKFFDIFKNLKEKEYNVNSDTAPSQYKNLIGYFLHGIKLKSYSFEKYKTKKNKKNISVNLV